MGANVELMNNPYRRRLRILINGEAVSIYSNLVKYMDEPFYSWCDRILDEIYEECNYEEFSLHVQSRGEELEIMEKLAGDYPYCIQYSSSPLIQPASLLDRMKKLNRMIRDAYPSGYQIIRKQAVFLLPESMKWIKEDLLGLEVKNSFCQVNSTVISYQEFIQNGTKGDAVFILSEGKDFEKTLDRLGTVSGFGICIGTKQSFLQKREGIFLYETTKLDVFETVFRCLLLSILPEVFCGCIDSLPKEFAQKHKLELEELQNTSIRIIPVPEKTTIEAGKSSRIQFQTDPKGYSIQGAKFHYSYSEKGIIRCNGLLVEGLCEGKAKLYIYQEGDQVPCAQVDYTVIKRNRITELKLEEDVLYLGEGDRIQMSYTFFPPDADNEKSIEWHSDNDSVAAVSKTGIIRAVKSGTCNIRCYAEQVSARCKCVVKPHLKSIVPDEKEMLMIYGQEKGITISVSPQNCIDGQIVMTSMNMQIVNIVGRKAKAVGVGSTRIIIQNKEETVRSEIKVEVISEAEFQRRQKKDQKGNETEKKKGLLSKLLHWL